MRARDAAFRDGVREAFGAVAAGELSAEVASVMPLSRFAEAAALMAERGVVGKIAFEGI